MVKGYDLRVKGYDLRVKKIPAKEQRIPPQHGTFGEKIHPHFAGNPKICVFSNVSIIKICVFSNISAKKICVFSEIFVFLHRQKA